MPAVAVAPDIQAVSWSSLAQRFQANLAAFDQRTGLGEAVAAAWRDRVGRLRLFKRSDECFQVQSRLPDSPGWLPAFAAHHRLADAAQLRQDFAGKIIRPLALCGLGLGYALRELIAATENTFLTFSTPVIAIERSLLAWAVALHLFDWRAIFSQPRVQLCAGPDALSAFDDWLKDLDRELPLVLSGGPAWPGALPRAEIEARVRAAEQTRTSRRQASFEGLQQLYAGRDADWWARRFAEAERSGPPLTIVGVTSRFTTVLQYAMRDWLDAFRRRGCRTELFIEPDDSAHFSACRLLEMLERTRPDLVLIIDHLQAEYPGILPENIPAICWIQDNLPNLFNVNAGRRVRPFEFICGFGTVRALTEFGYPARRFLPCEIPANPANLLDARERPEDLAPYRCDVMYATHYAGPPERLHESCRAAFTDENARRLVDAAYDTIVSLVRRPGFVGDYHFDGVLAGVARELGLQITDPATRFRLVDFLWRVADQCLRLAAVSAVAAWADATGRRFNLYGRGWETHPEFARFARGVVAHGVPLGRAYRAARISFHTGCNSMFHRRVLDGFGAGGFVLLRENPSEMLGDVWDALAALLECRPRDDGTYLDPAELPVETGAKYRDMLARRGFSSDRGLPVEPLLRVFLRVRAARLQPDAARLWPLVANACFRTEDELLARVEYFLTHAQERRALAADLRERLLEHCTYDDLVQRQLAFVTRGLRGENPAIL